MINRRMFTAAVTGLLTTPFALGARVAKQKAFFYASVGPRLTLYHLDAKDTTLVRRSSVTLPTSVQYAWPHPSANVLYVVSSNGAHGVPGDAHFANALRIDPATGALRPHGPPVALRSRPIHANVDNVGAYLLIAHNNPSGVTVLRIRPDGMIGEEIPQPASLDVGIFPHQIRTMPSNTAVVLVTRGNDSTDTKPEEPGALKVYGFKDGELSNRASIAPGNGFGFGPRHLDFHPSEPWVYVSLERQNKLQLYKLANDSIDPHPVFTKDTLIEPGNLRRPQWAGTVHVHPNGRYVYLGNRSDAMTEYNGTRIDGGGENNIAVFAIDGSSGEPMRIENVTTRGFHPRTFALDPSGHMLVVANVMSRSVRDGQGMRTQPATLETYRVSTGGNLIFVKSYDVETEGIGQFWSGMVVVNG